MAPDDIRQRKADHIEVAVSGAANFRDNTTLLEEVSLVHHAMPERAWSEVSLETTLLGKKLKAPVVITGMTGGTEEARAINRELAAIANDLGLAFGVGSQRAMVEHPDTADTFQVRDVAKDVLLIGNIGGVQARDYGPEAVQKLVRDLGADAMAVHLNPAQELGQENGDRDFKGVLATIAQLRETLDVPLLVKETGCGLSPAVAAQLAATGVKTVDTSGAGGTSWVAVEAERAKKGSREATRGATFREWGLPTAVSVCACASQDLDVIASGGIRSGHDIARALALGARAGGMAQPVLKALRDGGREGATAFLQSVLDDIRYCVLLTGARSASDLTRVPRRLGPTLKGWLDDLGIR